MNTPMTPLHFLARRVRAILSGGSGSSAHFEAADSTGAGGEETFEWSDVLPAGAELRVFCAHGDITVRPSPGDAVRVVGRRPNDPAGRWRVPRLRFRCTREGNMVTVYGEYEGSSPICGPEGIQTDRRVGRHTPRADFTIEVPPGIALHLGTARGNVEVAGATAAVRTSTGRGEVRVGSGAGPVAASSGSGTVKVHDAHAPVEASTGTGNVAVSTSRGPVTASTGTGNVDVNIAALPDGSEVKLQSGTGNVALSLPAGFSGSVDASTAHGNVDVAFPLRVEGRLSGGRVIGAAGESGTSVCISTGSGNVRVERHAPVHA
jgi:hypothetical protein